MSTLRDRVALVTGGSRGIGEAIARRLVADGAAVVLTHGSSPEQADAVVQSIRDDGGRALAVRADSADPDRIRAAVAAAVAEFGRLDIVVNNAGIGANAPMGELTLEQFDRAWAVNVRGPFVAVDAALPHLPHGGRIVMIGSVFAERTSFGGLAAYTATKAAVAGLARGMARDLAPRGITVNTVAPGAVETGLTADPDVVGTMTAATPLGRFAAPDEIAAVVAFLAGPGASNMTGSTVTVDGGYSV